MTFNKSDSQLTRFIDKLKKAYKKLPPAEQYQNFIG